MEKETATENGISITVKAESDKPGKCKIFYNPVMKICRELVLSCLSAYTEPLESSVKSLDAFGATGIGGMLWKRHLAEKVHVCINEMDPAAVCEIKANCSRNGLVVKDEPETEENDESVNPKGSSAGVEICQGDANVLMHQRQFHFIHLDPYGTTVQFLDSAFRNIYNTGVMVITSTDIASLYGKCQQVTLRNYSAYNLKTDYNKEVAARIVLAAAARAAARCNKGLKVLYCVAVEHFVQVAVQVCRGTQKADASLGHIRKVLHCLMCEEWALLPDSKAPIETPYSLLPCDCHSQNPGKTAVELGPLWAGNLYDAEFVTQMHKHSKKLSLSERVQTLTEGMGADAECRRRLSQPADLASTEQSTTEAGPKRPAPLHEDSTPAKRLRPNRELSQDAIPLFYYNLHRRKIKGGNLPKSNKLVTYLRGEGFRACRTPFDPEAVRTDATLKELVDIVLKNGPNS